MNHSRRSRIPEPVERVLRDTHQYTEIVTRSAAIAVIALLFMFVAILVYQTGGTQTAYLHLAYLPILIAASAFGVTGGVAAASVAGLGVVGPLMPLDTVTGESQPVMSWLFRLGFFLLIGIAAGIVVGRLSQQLKRIRAASLWHPVSELPTQLAMEHIIDGVLRRSRRDAPQGLIVVDVKNAEQIFNTLGPEISQHIPAAIAERLRSWLAASSQIYHIHAGKLAILASGSTASLGGEAEQALDGLAQPVTINGVPVYLDAVAGLASFRDDEDGARTVLQRANVAVAGARSDGRMLADYDEIWMPDKERAVRLLGDAPEAFEQDQFVLVYQPQIRISDGRVVGTEALVRWHHPTLGLLSPGEFIPLLEETALINRLTFTVARAAIRQAAQWQREGLAMPIAFNISPRNMDDDRLTDIILDEIREAQVGPDAIELEITESAIIHDAGRVRERLAALKAAGVAVAMDDFGDGYTSIRHLTELPIDKLKIDRSLVSHAHHDAQYGSIVATIIHLARNLGLKTVAEGVEGRETETFLIAEGCDVAQGFYYSKPVSADELVDFARQPGRNRISAGGTPTPSRQPDE